MQSPHTAAGYRPRLGASDLDLVSLWDPLEVAVKQCNEQASTSFFSEASIYFSPEASTSFFPNPSTSLMWREYLSFQRLVHPSFQR